MGWHITESERTYLRELAKKQAEYAALPIMAERKKMWYALNDGKSGARPPVIIDVGSLIKDFGADPIYPDGKLSCETETARSIEVILLKNIRNYEYINDDKVVPDTYEIPWFMTIDLYGVKIKKEFVKDARGVQIGFHFIHPITDIRTDLALLKQPACSVDREKTFLWKAFLEELFDGILPVRIQSGVPGKRMLTQAVIELMGMEAFFMAMYDTPDLVHGLMSYLRDSALYVMRWAEQEKLLSVNNGNQASFGASFNFTTKLSSSGDAKLSDMWSNANSQETVGISPEMFHEFCFPYYRDVCEPLGLLYYGCCEPVHPMWEDIKKLPHLKKVSISRWCDQRMIADSLRGTDVVFSRKPDPNFLNVDKTLNEDGWTKHIRETLELTEGVFTEFIIRDVVTVHQNINKAKRAVELARQEIDKKFS